MDSGKIGKYSKIKNLRPHILPYWNFVINGKGDIVVSWSYDRKAIIRDIEESCVINEWEGHKNVVYWIAINKPFEDKIATGSYDKTARIWSFPSGELLHILEGHTLEVVAIDFSPSGCLLATWEMNGTWILWNVDSGEIIHKLVSHSAEVIVMVNKIIYLNLIKYLLSILYDFFTFNSLLWLTNQIENWIKNINQ